MCQGRSQAMEKRAKDGFQILAKCCIFMATLSNKRRNFKTPFELIIPCVKNRYFYSVT